MRYTKIKPKNLHRILKKWYELCEDDPSIMDWTCEELNRVLEERSGDIFGTEGQLDPRGDRRD